MKYELTALLLHSVWNAPLRHRSVVQWFLRAGEASARQWIINLLVLLLLLRKSNHWRPLEAKETWEHRFLRSLSSNSRPLSGLRGCFLYIRAFFEAIKVRILSWVLILNLELRLPILAWRRGSTARVSITEVKQHWARLVVGWGTAYSWS